MHEWVVVYHRTHLLAEKCHPPRRNTDGEGKLDGKAVSAHWHQQMLAKGKRMASYVPTSSQWRRGYGSHSKAFSPVSPRSHIMLGAPVAGVTDLPLSAPAELMELKPNIPGNPTVSQGIQFSSAAETYTTEAYICFSSKLLSVYASSIHLVTPGGIRSALLSTDWPIRSKSK